MVVINLGEGIFKMDGIVNKVFLNLLKVVGKYVGDEIRVGLSCWGSGRDKSDGIIIVI